MRIEKLTEASFGTMQKSMLRRSTDSYPKEEAAVAEILARVRAEGDSALFAYEKAFDHCELTSETVRVSEAESLSRSSAAPSRGSAPSTSSRSRRAGL